MAKQAMNNPAAQARRQAMQQQRMQANGLVSSPVATGAPSQASPSAPQQVCRVGFYGAWRCLTAGGHPPPQPTAEAAVKVEGGAQERQQPNGTASEANGTVRIVTQRIVRRHALSRAGNTPGRRAQPSRRYVVHGLHAYVSPNTICTASPHNGTVVVKAEALHTPPPVVGLVCVSRLHAIQGATRNAHHTGAERRNHACQRWPIVR